MALGFPFFQQRDAMDCGPTCLMMVAAAYGRQLPLPYLRELSYIGKDGVSAQGIMEAAERIGFRAMTVKIPLDSGKDTACLMNAPLPCIAHWEQQHFVVVYKVSKQFVWVADPGAGKFRLTRKQFEQSWVSDAGQGIVILLEPTPAFYQTEHTVVSGGGYFRTLWNYLQPHTRLLLQVLLGMALGSLLLLLFPLLTQSIVDQGINARNLGFIHLILLAQLILFASQLTIQFLQTRILLFIGTRVNVSMVNDFLAKLMRLPLGFFDTKMTGDLMQRIGDQTRIETFLTQSALPVLFSLFHFLVFSVILFFYNSAIFGVFSLAALLYLGWITFFLRRRKELDYIRFRQSGENNHTLIEMIQGMQEIKLQGSERKRRTLWTGIQAQLFQTNWKSLNLAQWQDAGAGFINQSKNILITFLAAQAVIDGHMTLGMMLATQYMVGQLDAPLQQFITFIRSAQDARISLERMNEIHQVAEEGSAFNSINWETFKHSGEGSLYLENLSFRYNALHEDVLKNITLHIPQGQVTAIVGASGSGKTTLLKLLLGFYTPTQGQIRVGSIPLSSIHAPEWRKGCGSVMQDGFIFSDTIANNIAECDEHPEATKLLKSVEMANIRSFVETLPLQYNTKIGARGNGISQGQRQRLLIARAVYKNPDYLFFDEATNALDANNERAIVENLEKFYKPQSDLNGHSGSTKTVVVVAHRLSTVKHADQIVVLDKGCIVEKGTHAELAAKRGFYYDLVKNQLELGN
ncbi:MAG: peptidase domain-containing ABC transporter [Saprospiraceae bacterium]|nr:peptidase domain-containing ABC transporter [Saprospiraceae bacterium]